MVSDGHMGVFHAFLWLYRSAVSIIGHFSFGTALLTSQVRNSFRGRCFAILSVLSKFRTYETAGYGAGALPLPPKSGNAWIRRPRRRQDPWTSRRPSVGMRFNAPRFRAGDGKDVVFRDRDLPGLRSRCRRHAGRPVPKAWRERWNRPGSSVNTSCSCAGESSNRSAWGRWWSEPKPSSLVNK